MTRRPYGRCALALLGAALLAQPAHADDGNYQNYVIGERSAGMGGAGASLATGAEACYYNPAGLALAPANSISLSASLYGFHRRTVKDGWFPGEDTDIDTFMSIPSTFGAVVKPTADLVLAFSAFVPDKQYTSDLAAFPREPGVGDEHFFRYTLDDQTIWLGPTAAYRLTPRWSVGLSVFATYRQFSQTIDYFLIDYGYSSTSDVRFTAFSLLGEVGVRYDPDSKWSFGLMMQSPSIHLQGHSDLFVKNESTTMVGLGYFTDGSARNDLPAAIRAGLSWQEPRRYAVAFDANYHFPVTYDRISGIDNWGDQMSLTVKRNAVLDVNLGAEYYVLPGYPLRAGVFTSFSSSPETSVESSGYEDNHIDKYGITLGVGRETANTTLGVGVSYVFGTGRGVGLANTPSGLATALVDEDDSYLLINLSSSYSF